MIQNIFSIGISIFELKNINNSDIVDYAKSTTKVNEFKENKDILVNSLFKDLNCVVEERMNEYCKSIYNDKHEIKLFEAWSNIGNDKLITIPHTHNESFLSAVYYPQSTDGEIIFLNPSVAMVSKHKNSMIDNHNEYTSEYYSFPARTGHLIIFNSMLQHMVRCNNSDRVSIAYNGIIA